MMSEFITIQTDQGPLTLPVHSTLEQAVALLLQGHTTTERQVATAVNGQFVSRGDRERHVLCDGDTVLCFSPITGG